MQNNGCIVEGGKHCSVRELCDGAEKLGKYLSDAAEVASSKMNNELGLWVLLKH